MEHIETLLAGTDAIETCTRKRVNTMLNFLKLTNVTIFAALLKYIPMGWEDTVLPQPVRTVNCLTLEQNTRQPDNDIFCLFRALCLHLHGKEGLEEETNKLFTLTCERKKKFTQSHFKVIAWTIYQLWRKALGSIFYFTMLTL